ncbi:MAG: chemotaxis protein CheC [Gaiellales bacterium]
MSESVHLLVVTAGGENFGLPMDMVEQTFDLSGTTRRNVGCTPVVVVRGEALELCDLAEKLGAGHRAGQARAGVIVWAGGHRRVFAVDGLVGQMWLDRIEVPRLARSAWCSGVVLDEAGEVVPIVEPGAVVGAWSLGSAGSLGFTQMQRSALLEVANIGSGHAATALSQMLGKPVEIGYSEALLTVLAEAIDRIGAPTGRSAVVDTPVAGDGGTVLLVFPDEAADQLCSLLGTTMSDPMGRSALQEIGNILATSYLNAIVEMTGMDLEPEPPSVEVDLLGDLLGQSAAGRGAPGDPTILMRSHMTVESAAARFSFFFVPRVASVNQLLDRLGVPAAA